MKYGDVCYIYATLFKLVFLCPWNTKARDKILSPCHIPICVIWHMRSCSLTVFSGESAFDHLLFFSFFAIFCILPFVFFLSPFLPALKMWFWVHLHFAKSCILGSSLYFPYIITLLINMNNLWHKNFNSQTSRASCFRHTCELCISNFSCVTNQTHSRKLT